MKKIALAAAIAVAATATYAGNLEPVIMEPEIIVEETASTGGGLIVPLLLVAVIATAVATAN